MLLEPSVATLVALRPIAHIVAYAVDFDRESRSRTIKIEHKATDRMLSPKYRFARLSRA
jgi:hypothetical protein